MKITIFHDSPRFRQVATVSGDTALQSAFLLPSDEPQLGFYEWEWEGYTPSSQEERIHQVAKYMLELGIMRELIRLKVDDTSGTGVALRFPIRTTPNGEELPPVTADWAGRGDWSSEYSEDYGVEWCLFVNDSLESVAAHYSIECHPDKVVVKFAILNTDGVGILPAYQP
jgi:hypothetical protein